MRSLLVTTQFSPILAGAPRVYEALARAFGGKMAIFTAVGDHLNKNRPTAGVVTYDQAADFPIYRVPSITAAVGHRPGLGERTLRGTRVISALIRALKEHKPDCLILSSPHRLGWLMPVIRRVFNGPVLLYLHGEEVSTLQGLPLFRQIRYGLEADGALVVSNFIAETLADLGFPKERIGVIPNGVDAAFRDMAGTGRPWRDYLSLPKNARIVLSCGRLIERKGFGELLTAWEQIVCDQGDAHLLIAGDGPEKARLQNHPMASHPRVRLLGEVDDPDLASLYADADLFILANRTLHNGDTEGFGLVFLEAGLFGVPSIGGAAGGVGDAIQHGVTGLLVDAKDRAAITAALNDLLRDDAKRHAMGRAAQDHAHRQAWSGRAALIESFYQQTIQGRLGH